MKASLTKAIVTGVERVEQHSPGAVREMGIKNLLVMFSSI